MLCVASSTGGKSVLIANLILKIYRGSFERIYIFSPSVHVDDTWRAVKKYITDVMKVDTEKEKVYYQEYDLIASKPYYRNTTQGNRLPEEKETKGII